MAGLQQVTFNTSPLSYMNNKPSTGENLANMLINLSGNIGKMEAQQKELNEKEDEELGESELISYNDYIVNKAEKRKQNNFNTLDYGSKMNYLEREQEELLKVTGNFKSSWFNKRKASILTAYNEEYNEAESLYIDDISKKFLNHHLPATIMNPDATSEDYAMITKSIKAINPKASEGAIIDMSIEELKVQLANMPESEYTPAKGNSFAKGLLDFVKDKNKKNIIKSLVEAKDKEVYTNAVTLIDNTNSYDELGKLKNEFKNLINGDNKVLVSEIKDAIHDKEIALNTEYSNDFQNKFVTDSFINKDSIDWLNRTRLDALNNKKLDAETKSYIINKTTSYIDKIGDDKSVKAKEKWLFNQKDMKKNPKKYVYRVSYETLKKDTQFIADNYNGEELVNKTIELENTYTKIFEHQQAIDLAFNNIPKSMVPEEISKIMKDNEEEAINSSIPNIYISTGRGTTDEAIGRRMGATPPEVSIEKKVEIVSNTIAQHGSIPTKFKDETIRQFIEGDPIKATTVLQTMGDNPMAKAIMMKDKTMSMIYALSKSQEFNISESLIEGIRKVYSGNYDEKDINKKAEAIFKNNTGLPQEVATNVSAYTKALYVMGYTDDDKVKEMVESYIEEQYVDTGDNLAVMNPPKWLDKDAVSNLNKTINNLEIGDGNQITVQGSGDNIDLFIGDPLNRVRVATINSQEFVGLVDIGLTDNNKILQDKLDRAEKYKKIRDDLMVKRGELLLESLVDKNQLTKARFDRINKRFFNGNKSPSRYEWVKTDSGYRRKLVNYKFADEE